MAQFPILRLTRAGQDLAGMSQGGGKLIFVRAELGDGQLGEGESVEMLHALKRRVMQLPLQGYLNEGNGKARLRFVVDNSSLTAGFFNREIGIVAKMEGGDEQLYAYTNAGNYADYIPSKDTPIDSEIIDLHILIGNASHVVLETQNGAYATKIELEEHRTAAELDHPDGSVTTPKLRDAAVTGVKIADGVIDKKHLAADVKTLISDAGIAILGRNRSYQVGDIAYHKALPSWARLECVKAGTTGATLPNLSDARENDHITDGTVEWVVGKTATLEQLTKSLTGKADCSLGNILESAKTVINDAVIVRSLLAENGYIVFANGLIIQWGCVYGEQVTTPNQSILITPLVSISKELFSCGNVNVAGGNTDYNWKNNRAIVSTIYSQGDKKLSVSSTFFGKTYITRWLLIGV